MLSHRNRVLLIAEDIDLRKKVARSLSSSGYALELASDGQRALRLVANENFLVAIVAAGPGAVGLVAMLELRNAVRTLIAVGETTDQVSRLHRSVAVNDVYLRQPNGDDALLSWLGKKVALAVAAQLETPTPNVLSLDRSTLDLRRRVFTTASGKEITLTRAETNLLTELAASPRHTVSRDKLRHAVSGRGADPFDRSIDMLVARLRRKIEPDPKLPRFIVTAPGTGYKLMVAAQSTGLGPSPIGSVNAERRHLTALCCKLAGAAGFSIHLDPEDLSETVRSFQDAASHVITEIGGTITSTASHQILALFGYPEAHEDDAELAANAALRVTGKIAELLSPQGRPLQAHVGLATGVALTGEGQTISGPPSIAAALCDLAAPGSVLIDASTRRLLSDAFVCGEVERQYLANVSELIGLCVLRGMRPVVSRFKAKHAGKTTFLVGRDRELEQLLALWERAKYGEGQVALLCGEAGIGKSHLCQFLLDHLTEQFAVLRWQCSPQHRDTPLYPLIGQLEQAIGIEQADALEAKLDKLEAALSETGETTREELLLFAAFLSIATPEQSALAGFTPHRRKELTFAAVIRHLRFIANKEPLIITFSDAHWADSSTLEFIGRIIPSIRTIRALLLVQFRPEFVSPWLKKADVTMLHLQRIGRGQSRAIVGQLAGGNALSQEIEEQIIDKSDGIPLFVEELTKSVLESSELAGDRKLKPPLKGKHVPLRRRNEGSSGASAPANARLREGEASRAPRTIARSVPIPVPPTLLSSLTARLDRLGPAKEIAQIGAVIGREFSTSLLAAVAAEAADALQQLTASDLVSVHGEDSEATYKFAHALVRDAAYESLPRGKRQRLHRRVAEVLENSFPLTIEGQPALVAHHFAEAGLTERAIDYLRKAAAHAIRTSALSEAIAHLTRGLELLRRLPDSRTHQQIEFDLQSILAQVTIAAYGYAAQVTRETLDRASALINESSDAAQRFSVLYGVWASHYVSGEVEQEQKTANDFFERAQRNKDAAILSIAHRIVGTTEVMLGRHVTALHRLRQAKALYDPEHHAEYRHRYGQDIGAAALCYESWALWHLGYVDQAARAAAEAMSLAESVSHPHTLVYTVCHVRGLLDLFRRSYQNIQSYVGRLILICNENGFSHWANCCRILDGWAAVCAGDFDGGMRELHEGVAGWQKGGARLWLPLFLKLMAEGSIKVGRHDAALQMIEQAQAICERDGRLRGIAEVLRVKAEILLSRGAKSSEVETILLDSLSIARHQQARIWELRTSCDLARLWQRRGRTRKALALMQSVYGQFTEGFETADLRAAHALLRSLS